MGWGRSELGEGYWGGVDLSGYSSCPNRSQGRGHRESKPTDQWKYRNPACIDCDYVKTFAFVSTMYTVHTLIGVRPFPLQSSRFVFP